MAREMDIAPNRQQQQSNVWFVELPGMYTILHAQMILRVPNILALIV
jgi:hypothetical protein